MAEFIMVNGFLDHRKHESNFSTKFKNVKQKFRKTALKNKNPPKNSKNTAYYPPQQKEKQSESKQSNNSPK